MFIRTCLFKKLLTIGGTYSSNILNKLFILGYLIAQFFSGLLNDILDDHKPFDKSTCLQILGFLESLPAPICLVAFNGNEFDYPILANEFALHNVVSFQFQRI